MTFHLQGTKELRAREARGIFDVRNVCGMQLGVVSAWNMIREKMAIGRRRGRVVSSGNHQGRNSNVGDDGTRVKVPDSAASADVTLSSSTQLPLELRRRRLGSLPETRV